MKRFFTALTKALLPTPSPFQAAQASLVTNLAPGRAIRTFSTIVKTIWRRPRAAIVVKPAKVFMTGLSLGALLTVPNSAQGASAQRPNTAREQALRECNLMDRRDTHEPWEGTKSGGRLFVYKDCMADHGQPE